MKDLSGQEIEVRIKGKRYGNVTDPKLPEYVDLPNGKKIPREFYEYRVDPHKIFDVANKERIVIDKVTGDAWYSPVHYKHFIKIVEGVIQKW